MPRHNTDRELFRHATGLVERAELMTPQFSEPVIIGFRREGAACVYIGGDLAYLFNSAGELRLAHADGRIYRAELGRLVALKREPGATEVAMFRSELSAEEQAAFVRQARQSLSTLAADLRGGSYQCRGEVASEPGFPGKFGDWLTNVTAGPLKVAAAPNAR